jgi:hypothetical protein
VPNSAAKTFRLNFTHATPVFQPPVLKVGHAPTPSNTLHPRSIKEARFASRFSIHLMILKVANVSSRETHRDTKYPA